jgi:exodeoxyribonuclease I
MTAFSFFWHDYETFGRVPRRDRPAQFAGIRTDAELNEVGRPVMHYCRPSPDSLPDPESCLLTGIVPQTCLEQGLPEHQFAAAIEGALAQPGTIGVGYNTIRFDDEVTRHLFWRNLIDPYAREWQNECGRWDLLDVVRATWALRPEGIEWPRQANGIAHEAAHDALSDVRATIALARLIRTRQPRLWEFCLKLRRKEAVWAEIGAHRPFLHISGMFGVEQGCTAIVYPLAQHPTNKNELLVWDLAHDPQELAGLGADTLRQRLFTRSADLPEGVTRLPIKSIHANKSPIVIGNLKTLSPEVAARYAIDVDRAMRHAQAAPDVATLMQGAWREVYARPPAGGPVDVDEDLYGGFVGNDDRRKLERLRPMSGEQLAGQRVAFDDRRLEEILFRYRARNFPGTLSAQDNERWVDHCSARLHEGAGGSTTLPEFFERIDQLNEEAEERGDERGQEILGALYDYAEQIAPPLREGA